MRALDTGALIGTRLRALRSSTCLLAVVLAASGSLIATPARAVQIAQTETTQPADPGEPLSDEDAVPPESGSDDGSLTNDIDDLQNQIDTESATEQAKQESRQKVADLMKQADARSGAGDLAGAEALLEQARQAALPDDALTRNRVALALITVKIRRGDLAGASGMLDQLTGAETLTETEKARIETLKSKLAAATTDAERQAVVAEITTLADEAAIGRAREEAKRDPGNFGIRLVLGDLLRKVGQLTEAGQVGEALLADTTSAQNLGVHQRAIVLLGRIACDRSDFDAARRYLELLRASGETPQKAQRVADLEQRIAKLEARAAQTAIDARRKAAIDEIVALTGDAAIDRANEVIKADPGNLGARLLLGDLLRKAGRFGEAQKVADALIADTTSEENLGVRQRSIVLLGRIAVDRGDFTAARGYLEMLRTSGETPQKAQRIADLDEHITKEEARLAERAATEARKARERAEKERLAAENARIDAELAAIAALPGAEALARAKAFYESNPSNDKVANAYARLLSREGHWREAEAVYLSMTGPLDEASNAVLVDNNAAVFGLVDLYSRTNQLAKANGWLTRLEGAYGTVAAAPPDRTNILRTRIDTALQPDQLSGSITLSAGNNSDVAAPFDDNPDDDFLPTGGDSNFVEADIRLRYDRVITPNGDKLRLQARLVERPYFDIDNVDRLTIEVNGGYVYNVPASQTQIRMLGGYRSRYVDYDSYRRTVYGLLDVDADLTRRLTSSATLIVERNDDDNDNRDGYAFDGSGGLRYDLTEQDTLALGADVRYEDAQLDTESRLSFTPSLSFRHDFTVGNLDGFYAFGSYSPSFIRYGGPQTSGADIGVTREDFTQKLAFGLGRAFADDWRIEAGANYYVRQSNLDSKDTSATQVMFSITRRFSN